MGYWPRGARRSEAGDRQGTLYALQPCLKLLAAHTSEAAERVSPTTPARTKLVSSDERPVNFQQVVTLTVKMFIWKADRGVNPRTKC